MKSMTKKEKEAWVLMIDCLREMGLPKENIIAIATILQKKNQVDTMLDWIKRHHMEKPHKLIVMLVAIRLKDGINAEITDSLIQGVRLISNSFDLMTEVVMTMKSEHQMRVMIDYICKHQKENPSGDEVIQVAQKISEQVI